MSTKLATAVLAASTIACSASAGLLTMSASNSVGTDDWSGLTGYSMSLTIDCATLDTAGSASTFTLAGWTFKAFDSTGTMKFHAAGSGETFTVSGGGSKFLAVIGLSNSNILVNDFAPAVQSIAFSYAFAGSESLDAAIGASAGTTDGELSLGTDLGNTGILAGTYAVPAPGAMALLGLAGVASRRRRA
jgi:hypothetical protein